MIGYFIGTFILSYTWKFNFTKLSFGHGFKFSKYLDKYLIVSCNL